MLLDRRGQTEHRVLRITAKGTDRDHDRPADGQRAGLVEGHDLDGAGCLQAITALEHDAAAGPAGDGRQNRRRDRNHHRAGRRDHENRHRTVDGLAPFEIKPQAGDEQHEDRHPDHHHGIDRTDPLGHALGARARFFRLFDHPHDLRQRAVSSAGGGLDPQDAELIQSRGVDRVADEFVHRDRLAGHRGFVHRRLPGHDRTIHRNPISRPHYDHVAGREIFNRNFDRLLLARHPGHLRAQFHQRLNRPPGPGHGVVFKGGAEREQKHQRRALMPEPDRRRSDGRRHHQHVHVHDPLQGRFVGVAHREQPARDVGDEVARQRRDTDLHEVLDDESDHQSDQGQAGQDRHQTNFGYLAREASNRADHEGAIITRAAGVRQ